jgi:hypothetical protein
VLTWLPVATVSFPNVQAWPSRRSSLSRGSTRSQLPSAASSQRAPYRISLVCRRYQPRRRERRGGDRDDDQDPPARSVLTLGTIHDSLTLPATHLPMSSHRHRVNMGGMFTGALQTTA